jgi:hypothetical protein
LYAQVCRDMRLFLQAVEHVMQERQSGILAPFF